MGHTGIRPFQAVANGTPGKPLVRRIQCHAVRWCHSPVRPPQREGGARCNASDESGTERCRRDSALRMDNGFATDLNDISREVGYCTYYKIYFLLAV